MGRPSKCDRFTTARLQESQVGVTVYERREKESLTTTVRGVALREEEQGGDADHSCSAHRLGRPTDRRS